MSINPITLIEKAINERGSSTILKERLALASDQFNQLEKENQNLKSVNEALKKQIAELESKNVPENFFKERGVLFLKLPDGNFARDAYCPSCKIVMFSLEGELPFTCSKCKFTAGFTGHEIDGIIGEISKHKTNRWIKPI